MKKLILSMTVLCAMVGVVFMAGTASADDAIATCPSWGCGSPPPLTELPVPQGTYSTKTENGELRLVVSGASGATIFETYTNEPSIRSIGHLPALVMNVADEFAAQGTMRPYCDPGRACPQYILLIHASGTYHPGAQDEPATIDLSLNTSRGSYHLVQEVPAQEQVSETATQ